VKLILSKQETLILPSDKYALMNLREGSVIDNTELKTLKEIEEIHSAEQKGLVWLRHRAHSIAELRSKLSEELYSLKSIEEVIGRFIELGYLNDEAFAENWISAQLKQKPVGKLFLSHGLFRKGIKRSIAARVLEAVYPSEIEEEYCEKLIQKLAARRGLDKNRILPSLSRRGFSIPVIHKVFNKFIKKER
jgi:regulatory protein